MNVVLCLGVQALSHGSTALPPDATLARASVRIPRVSSDSLNSHGPTPASSSTCTRFCNSDSNWP